VTVLKAASILYRDKRFKEWTDIARMSSSSQNKEIRREVMKEMCSRSGVGMLM
jgi:hypothetical protein